jgi:hypothetical protein
MSQPWRSEPASAEKFSAEKSDAGELPSWAVGICGVAAVASVLFSILLFLNR